MDKASQALAKGVPERIPESYRALADHFGVPHTTYFHRKNGRRSLEEKAQSQQYLSPWEEEALVMYLLQLADLGQPVRMKYIPSLAFCIARQRPVARRPLKPPHKNWPKAFERRHPQVEARRVTALEWNRHEKHTYPKIVHWFEVIERVLHDPAILQENVYNMDETGVMLSMLGSVKVLVGKNDIRKYRGARVKRTMVTSIECISADGRYLNSMIIWPASTHRSNWTVFETPGWQYALSESGFTDSYISLEWLKRVFGPETKDRANRRPRVLICDGFGTHETLEILEFCFLNNIILCRLPSHTSHKLQPCDVAAFAPLKTAYRDQVKRLERGGVNTIGKEHFTSLYYPARLRAFTPRNIKSGFAATGLFPFDPDRVLRTMPKPPAELTIPQANPPDTLLKSPVTPVSAKGLISLQNIIVKQDAHALDDVSKRSLQRHLEKFAKAAQLSFAKAVLQQNQLRLMMAINNEAKARRSTKPLILGTAKGSARILSFEELVEARVKRAEEDAAKEAKGKGKRCRKPKNLTMPETVGDTTDKVKRGRKRKSATVETEAETEAEPKPKKLQTSNVLEPTSASIKQLRRMRMHRMKMYRMRMHWVHQHRGQSQ